MKCSKCGAEVPETSKFCPSCGNPVNADSVNVGNIPPFPPQGAGTVPPTGNMQSTYRQPFGQANPGYPQGYPQPPYPPKKNNNVLLVSIIAIASVVICALLLLIFLGKSDEEKWEKDTEEVTTENVVETTEAKHDTVYVQAMPVPAPEKKVKKGSLHNIGFTQDYSDYVCYARLTDSDVAGLSSAELRILRNTIFARHGRKFKSADLRNYFSRFDWYTPLYDEISESSLTPIERHNIMLIKKYE